MERHVPDEHVRLARQRPAQHVGLHDGGRATELAPQGGRAAGVELDGRQRSAEPREFVRERAAARPELDDRAVGARGERGDPVDDAPVDEEVLPEFVSAAVVRGQARGGMVWT